MKLKNVVVGAKIEAKRNTTGECHEPIEKGTVLEVSKVLEASPHDVYRVRVDAEYLEDGFAYVDPADFRKVKEVTEEPTEYTYKVGDKVLVGSEGAGYNHVLRDLADKVCTVTEVREDKCLRVRHPEVPQTHAHELGYLTYPQYVSPYVEPTPVKEFQEGDTVRITRTHKARHGEQVHAGDTCGVINKFSFVPDMYTLKHPNGGFGQVTIHQDDLELVEEPTELHDFRDGDVLLCTTACEGKHQEKCIEGRLYRYVGESASYIGRVRVGDPELYLGEASVLPENFTLYARKVEEDAAL